MKKSRFSNTQIIAILQQAKAGTPMPKLCGEHNISNQTFYSWRRKFRDNDSTAAEPMPSIENKSQQSKPIAKEQPKNLAPKVAITPA